MRKILVKVPAGQKIGIRGGLIRPIFDVGIPGYFSLTMDIPPQFFEMEIPAEDYSIILCDERIPRINLLCGEIHVPSIQQVLWAIGWNGTNLTKFIYERPVRFLHQPFRSHKCPWEGREAWRQIIVSRKGCGFSIETVCVADRDLQKMFFGYIRPAGSNFF